MVVYKEAIMVRTQIYFEEETLKDLKSISKRLNISVSEIYKKGCKKRVKRESKR